jgi:butyrate kinase
MTKVFKILAINPGSTSTKLGLFENEKLIKDKKIMHSTTELDKYANVMEQVDFRLAAIVEFLKELDIKPEDLGAAVGRGGLVKPLSGGTYRINEELKADLRSGAYGEHASNLGALLAHYFTLEYAVPSYIVDPVIVDEWHDIARYSGMREIPRTCVWHALNIRSVVRQSCTALGLKMEEENFVAVHLGGGISVASIEKGRCIDCSNGLIEGPFSPERAGDIPPTPLVELCFSGKYSKEQIKRMLIGKGGVVDYLGTSNLIDVENKVLAGDPEFCKILSAMAYQISKAIGSYVTVLKGKVNRIIITGGGAYCKPLVDEISSYVSSFAPIHLVPGEDELMALSLGALRVLRNEEVAKEY